jgi:hypothetical protein
LKLKTTLHKVTEEINQNKIIQLLDYYQATFSFLNMFFLLFASGEKLLSLFAVTRNRFMIYSFLSLKSLDFLFGSFSQAFMPCFHRSFHLNHKRHSLGAPVLFPVLYYC